MEHECKRTRLPLTTEQLEIIIKEDLRQPNCNSLDDFYAALGYGGLTLTKLMPRIREYYQKRFASAESAQPLGELPELRKPTKGGKGVIVDGVDNLEVKLARCCSPLQGEKIVGFATQGHGITIHTEQCKKYREALERNDPEEMGRWLPAYWASDAPAAELKANIEILCVNGMNLLNDVTTVIGEAHLPVSNFNLHMRKDVNAIINVTVSVTSLEQLDTLLRRLRTVRDVISADRAAY